MIPLKDMRDAMDLKPLSRKMIEELAAVGEVVSVPAGEYLFHEGAPAAFYYILKEGEVVLEFEEEGGVSMERVTSGMGVGCSSLAGLKTYSSHAICTKHSKLLRWSQKDLRHLFNQDSRLGYLMIKAMAKLLTRRISIKSHKQEAA